MSQGRSRAPGRKGPCATSLRPGAYAARLYDFAPFGAETPIDELHPGYSRKVMTPLIDILNPAPPAPEAAVTDPPPEEPTAPYQPPSRDELHQDWPLDPNARAPIVAGLLAMTQRGATKTYINKDGETVTVQLKPRESLRAMRTLNALGRMS